MKFFYQLALLSILLARFVPPSYAVCHTDDLKIGLEEITKLYRKSIDILMDVLDPQSTTISLDFENVLDTVTSYESLKHEYVMAVKKIYEISWKLDRNYGKDGSWRSFSRAAVQIRNKMNILNKLKKNVISCIKQTKLDKIILIKESTYTQYQVYFAYLVYLI